MPDVSISPDPNPCKNSGGGEIAGIQTYPLHPITREYADFTAAEADAMRASLRGVGLITPIVLWHDQVVDGRNRQELCNELGIGTRYNDITERCPTDKEMRAHVAALNEHRRSRTTPLTNAEKRERVAAALKIDPERSHAAIAEEVGVTDKTVASVRAELERGSEIPNLPPANRKSRSGKKGEGQHRAPRKPRGSIQTTGQLPGRTPEK